MSWPARRCAGPRRLLLTHRPSPRCRRRKAEACDLRAQAADSPRVILLAGRARVDGVRARGRELAGSLGSARRKKKPLELRSLPAPRFVWSSISAHPWGDRRPNWGESSVLTAIPDAGTLGSAAKSFVQIVQPGPELACRRRAVAEPRSSRARPRLRPAGRPGLGSWRVSDAQSAASGSAGSAAPSGTARVVACRPAALAAAACACGRRDEMLCRRAGRRARSRTRDGATSTMTGTNGSEVAWTSSGRARREPTCGGSGVPLCHELGRDHAGRY